LIKSLCRSLGLEPLASEAPDTRPPPEKIRDHLEGADLFVGVLTKLDPIGSDTESWRTSQWIEHEIGMAYDARKRILLLVEDNVRTGGLLDRVSSHLRFRPPACNCEADAA
jgi:hypothetical protein